MHPRQCLPKNPQTVAENVQSSDDVLSLDDLQQRHRSLSKRVAQTHRCADLVWHEIRHLQKTFDLTDVIILDDLDDGSCVIASPGGGRSFALNRAARRVAFDAGRAEIKALRKAREDDCCLDSVQGKRFFDKVELWYFTGR